MIVKCNDKEKSLLARLMRAEAKGEGNLGMLMVGNVGLNRIIAKCLTFKDIRTFQVLKVHYLMVIQLKVNYI